MPLTKAAIEDLNKKPADEDAYVWCDELPGFGVRRPPDGRRLCFVVKFKPKNGRQAKRSLGAYSWAGIKHAREIARDVMAKARLGDDPMPRKTAPKARVLLLGEQIGRYLKFREGDLRPRYMVEVRRHLLQQFASLHGLEPKALTRGRIVQEIDRLAEESGKTAADRARASLSALCSWMLEREVIDANPCNSISRRATGGGRERVLAEAELAAIWKACGDAMDDYPVVVKLLLLTGQRRDEVGGVQWSEVDLDKRQIALPAERTKNGRPHIIPLNDQALALLAALPVGTARMCSAAAPVDLAAGARAKSGSTPSSAKPFSPGCCMTCAGASQRYPQKWNSAHQASSRWP
jgi:hypothetical protein